MPQGRMTTSSVDFWLFCDLRLDGAAPGAADAATHPLRGHWLSLQKMILLAEQRTSDSQMLAKLHLLRQAMEQARQVLDAWQTQSMRAAESRMQPNNAGSTTPSILGFLSKVALLGIEIEAFEPVRDILTVAARLRGDLPHFSLMMVLLDAKTAGPLQARRQLFQIVEDFPQFEMGAAMLALIDKQVNFAGWKGLAQTLLMYGSDSSARQLAQIVLEMEEFDGSLPALLEAVSQSAASL
jgi:hypothetical protein